ncbi:MAG: DUF6282 family protein [Chloroflexota bacterium]|nr:DUF6282 family protein [Chloroflexota bacterium]
MRSQVEALLKGAFDFRIHTGPEPDGERRTDYLEAGRDAYEAEMAGFVLMKHRHPTALAAYALNRMYPGFQAVGSIVLNTSVGGLNPDAVEAAAKLGAKVVWMPTQDAGTIGLLDAPDDIEAVLEVAKTHGMAVASTHASFADTEMLVGLANSMGLVRLLVTNPVARFGADEGNRLLSQYLYVELPFLSYYDGQDAGVRLRADIERIGAGRCIVSTDFGQWTNPPPAEGMRMAIAAMLDAGMREADITKVVRTNPLNCVGLPVD